MKKYRKTDKEYIDDYDRHTIEWLKKLEAESTTPIYMNDKSASYHPMTLFYNMAVRSAQGKEETIRERKKKDEHKDWLLEHTTAPRNIKCKICDTLMLECGHSFEENGTKLMYFFECPNGHFPRRLIHPNGREELIPEERCKKCGHSVNSKTKRTKKALTLKSTCIGCGDVQIIEYSLKREPIKPIDEAERKKYCTDFIGKATFEDDLKALSNLYDYIKERQTNEEKEKSNGVDKIEKLTLPKVEYKLSEALEKTGYCKLSFEKPETGKYFIVPFSIQDPTDRTEKDSVKILTKAINKTLFPTNWRLMATQINYRLGYISGKIKSFEQLEDLIKIGREIMDKSA